MFYILKATFISVILGMGFIAHAQVPEGKTVISSLYVYDVQSGKSTLILEEKRHFEAPNWSHDGSFLLINAYGKLEKVSINGTKLGTLNTGSVQKANNEYEYYQVAYTVSDEKTLARELAAFQNIRDGYPKYLLTMDFDTTNINGIQKINALLYCSK
jgi:FlaG/FlaF family flagellin (archaellin)